MEKQEIHIVFFSDTHCGFDFPLRPRVDRRHRGEDFIINFNIVLSYAVKTHVDLVVYGGDLDKNAIIRFIFDNHFSSDTVWPIKSARLRQILPATMNFTFSSTLFHSR